MAEWPPNWKTEPHANDMTESVFSKPTTNISYDAINRIKNTKSYFNTKIKFVVYSNTNPKHN